MVEVTTFKCGACNGAGGDGPIRKSTGLPFRPCIQCDGIGELERSVDDMWDRSGHMSAVAQLSRVRGTIKTRILDPRALRLLKEKEAESKKADWEKASAGISRRGRM